MGARERDILAQFVLEAVAVSFLGGSERVALGIALETAVGSAAEWPTVIDPGAVILALSSAPAIGLLFGFYPARRAAPLDPIEALRR